MTVEYTGSGSVRKNYGPLLSPSTKPDPAAAKESKYGSTQELEIRFTYDNLPGYSAASVSDALKNAIPALAAVTEFYVVVEQSFAGGTSLEFGSVKASDGTAVDADGFIPAAVGVTANLVAGYVICGRGIQVLEAPDAAGTAHVDGDGVYVAAATGPVCTVASLVSVVAVGTFTAGRARIVVRYLPNAG